MSRLLLQAYEPRNNRSDSRRDRHARLRPLVAAVLVALCASTVTSPASAEDNADALPFAQELAEAKASGSPVEIASERTLTDTVFANPSGTFTRESASAPIRLKDRGEWEDVDLSLEKVDGALRPKAALGNIRLSAGGDDPLLTMTTGTAATTLTWPSELPEPTIDGPSATYEGVFPDVDLKLTVSDVGVSQVLIVHTEAAASNPALRSLEIGTAVEGGSIEAEDGGYVVKDEIDRTVGVATAPVMWDSTGTVLDKDRNVLPDTSEGAIEQRATGPAHGDDITDVDLEVTDESLVLEPDTEALTGEDVSYPVYIDPVATSSTPAAWAMVFKQHPNTSFYKWTDSAGQGVGYQNYNGVSTKRLFFQHSISSVTKTQIIDATFKARMNWSASCTTRAVKVYRVSSVTSSRTWNNQPSWGDYQDSKSYSAGWSGCNPSGRDVVWDVTPGVTDAAAEGRTVIALGLRVSDEGDPLTWRRFRHTTVLRVEYNRVPYTPSSLMIAGKLCPSSGLLLRAQTAVPAMSAIVSDPDGDNVRGRFQWNAGDSVDTSQPASQERTSSYVAKGTRASMALPVGLVADTMPAGTWSFRARAQDPSGAMGPYSAKCTFTIDNTPSSEPQITNWPGRDDPDDRWMAGTNRSVDLSPAAGAEADTAGYAFTFNENDQAPTAKTLTPTSADKSMSVELPLPGQPALAPGQHKLRVWAYDAAGNRSATPALLKIEVFDGAPTSRSTYRFEDADDVAGKDSTGEFPMSIGTAERDLRRVESENGVIFAQDKMLSLNAATGALPSVSGTLVALDRSFSIAALLDPADFDTRTAMTAVTVRGSGGSKFAELGVEPTVDGYAYVFKLWDATAQTWAIARLEGEDGYLGTTLVVASYDPLSKTLSLSMPDRGSQPATSELEGNTPATLAGQQLVLGADTANGSRWTGGLDNLVIARGSLSGVEVGDLRGQRGSECHETEEGCE